MYTFLMIVFQLYVQQYEDPIYNEAVMFLSTKLLAVSMEFVIIPAALDAAYFVLIKN